MARPSDDFRGKSHGKNYSSAIGALGLFKKVVDGFKIKNSKLIKKLDQSARFTLRSLNTQEGREKGT